MPTPSQQRTKPGMKSDARESLPVKEGKPDKAYEAHGRPDLFGTDSPGEKGHPREKQGPERRSKSYYHGEK